MRRMKRRHLLWLLPLLTTAADAWAWGLYTHVYFAQALVWLVPVAHPAFAAAARRFPRRVMAGACLPDLALVGPLLRHDAFDVSHDWSTAAEVLAAARSDEDRALALGFASHLLSDIYAHNHFVPAHEIVWADVPVATHAACEWALDHHVAPQLMATPRALLKSEQGAMAGWVAGRFGCRSATAYKAIGALAAADGLLRFSGLPQLAFHAGRLADPRTLRRFGHYLSHTTRHLGQMDRLIAGEAPRWLANPERHQARAELAGMPSRLLRSRLPMPEDVFAT